MQGVAPLSVQPLQVEFVTEVIAASLGVAGTVLTYEYRRWRQSSKEERDEAKSWYKEVEGILANAKVKSQTSLLRSDFNREELANDFKDFSDRLNTKAETAPDRVPDEATDLIKSLIPIFKKGATVAEVTGEKDGYEALAEMFEMAQKEYSDDSDMDSAMSNAMELSALFDELTTELSELGMNSQEFSRHIEKMLEESETEEFLSLIAQFDDGDSVDDALSLPNRLFLEISASISHEAHSQIERIERTQMAD